ncbi:MAG TPA: P-II family nitrogen regulator [Rectinemataceae bacterium]|nr:P-II family nitrogen regulator [Rectinemataceae bacterium]
MVKIEAIVRPESLDAVVEALGRLGHAGLNVAEVRGHGRQKGMKELFRGREYENRFIPKVKIEVVVGDAVSEQAIDAVVAAARTGQIGDGKIFVSEVREAIRVRTGERGDAAV